MCGIIGISSNKSVSANIINSLKKLEYRGYDSAGIALHQKDSIFNLRTLGKVSLLEGGMIEQRPKSKLGIAHTRWATHGKPSEQNAHPHASSGEVHIVHNGIIENYLELTEKLTKDGYTFQSETDSEVIAHLLHQHFQSSGDLLAAMHDAIKELDGAFRDLSLDPQEVEIENSRVIRLPETYKGNKLGHNWSISWVADEIK